MNTQKDDFTLAHLLVFLDLLRDEIYEELLKKHGNEAIELLRNVQNEL
ncbi:hypothetical protein [Mesobacillus subterraneus]|nr:hypothetical protein [Mesobacillus subterraneus]